MKIAVFDSGIGGMTVLRELRARFRQEQFLYFGDTANVPYGTKSVAQVEAFCRSAAIRIRSRDPAVVIIACNTASSLALSIMREVLAPIPVFGVVEAGVAAVGQACRENIQTGPVLVLGTRATVKSRIYSRLLKTSGIQREVIEQECPLLVPMIEEGWIDHPILHLTLKEYIAPYLSLPPGLALLGCTHYPWIRPAFEQALPGWKVIDSAIAVADQLTRESRAIGGHQESPLAAPVVSSHLESPVTWYFSDPDAVSRSLLASESGSAPVESF